MSFLTRFDRWDPFEEMSTLRNRMDRLWNRMTNEEEPMLTPTLSTWTPTTDILETKDDIVLKAELPGIEMKDVNIEIENGILAIKGDRKAEKETEEKGYRRVERSYGSFFRSFTLPPNVNAEKIAASFNNGLLEIHMPKKESAKPRTIKVEVKKQLASAA